MARINSPRVISGTGRAGIFQGRDFSSNAKSCRCTGIGNRTEATFTCSRNSRSRRISDPDNRIVPRGKGRSLTTV
jgi:hypothetical protein